MSAVGVGGVRKRRPDGGGCKMGREERGVVALGGMSGGRMYVVTGVFITLQVAH